MTDAVPNREGLGTLAEHEGEWQVRFVRRLRHPLEKVWRAVTEPEHMQPWFPDEMVGERRAGAPLKFVNEQMDATYEGEMLVFEPMSAMEVQWGPTNRLRFELQADGDATVLTVVETLGELGEAARDGAGWHECLDRLEAALDGTEAPAFGTVWARVHPAYVEAFGPEASTIGPPEGWEPPQD
jgi:uncharacterized protein YndB with AHSA1/START domain